MLISLRRVIVCDCYYNSSEIDLLRYSINIVKRIVIDARESGTSTGRYVDKLIEHLYKIGSKHEFVIVAYPDRREFLKKIAPSYKMVETSYKEFSFGEQLGFKKQLKKLKADLVFFPMVQQPIMYRGAKVTAMLDLTTLRFRNPARNYFVFRTKQAAYYLVHVVAGRTSRQIITISNFVRNDVSHTFHIPESKITTTYNAADKLAEKAVPIKVLQGKRYLLYVGRPSANKNLNRLVDAFAILKKRNPDLILVLAGKTDSEYEKLRAYARKKVGQGVLFTGFVSDGQLRWLYENGSVYVFPSLSEGFGLPGLEAMQYELPVASSNATCLPEIYQDAAHYFNPFSAQHMATKVQQILDDPKLAMRLIANGNKVLKKYSWRKMADQTLAIFEKAMRT
ncbi:MAG: hypothetical protein QG553_874 [Patescibacteria group bacterium]|nr:hypothetical protein [Patescibacteria group bacterium]